MKVIIESHGLAGVSLWSHTDRKSRPSTHNHTPKFFWAFWTNNSAWVDVYFYCIVFVCAEHFSIMKKLPEYFKRSLSWWGLRGGDRKGFSHQWKLRQAGREGRSSTEGLIVYRVQSLLQELRGRSNRRLWSLSCLLKDVGTADKKQMGSSDDGVCHMIASETGPRWWRK